jgi:hypothetical protein
VRVRLVVSAFAIAIFVLLPGSAVAVVGGQPDGSGHPYVSFLDNGVFACSGVLLSPTVMLTAAHCFSDSSSVFGVDTVTGAPIVRVSFDPDLVNTPPAQRVWFFGSYYFDPQFALGSAGGVPGVDTHDVAVVIFSSSGCTVPAGRTGSCGAIPPAATGGQYGALPQQGLVDRLAMGTPIDLVGFGVQNFIRGGGPCPGPCTPQPGDVFTRFYGQTTLISSNDRTSGQFLKLHSNNSATCFGDSGGPNLLGGTNTVLALDSFGVNALCTSNSYGYRIDTPEALAWITTTIAHQGGGL